MYPANRSEANWRLATDLYRDAAAALVAAVDRVERIVQIADQVQQELQRGYPLPLRGVGIFQLRVELVDFVDDTILLGAAARRVPFRKRVAAEAGAGEVRAVGFEPRHMPASGGDAGLIALLHQNAGPRRPAGDVVLGEAVVLVGRQQRTELGAGVGIALLQQPIGDQRDGAVRLRY